MTAKWIIWHPFGNQHSGMFQHSPGSAGQLTNEPTGEPHSLCLIEYSFARHHAEKMGGGGGEVTEKDIHTSGEKQIAQLRNTNIDSGEIQDQNKGSYPQCSTSQSLITEDSRFLHFFPLMCSFIFFHNF